MITAEVISEKAKDINALLSCESPLFNYSVKISHISGDALQFYDNAFAIEIYEWYLIFTEHHGHFIYHKNDVKVNMYGREEVLKNRDEKIKDLLKIRVCDLEENYITVGLRIKSLSKERWGTVVKIEYDNDRLAWTQWDGENEPTPAFYGNDCKCEVMI